MGTVCGASGYFGVHLEHGIGQVVVGNRSAISVALPGNIRPASTITPTALAALNDQIPLHDAGNAISVANNDVTNFPTPISSNQADARIYECKLPATPSSMARILVGLIRQQESDYVLRSGIVNEFRTAATGVKTITSPAISACAIPPKHRHGRTSSAERAQQVSKGQTCNFSITSRRHSIQAEMKMRRIPPSVWHDTGKWRAPIDSGYRSDQLLKYNQ